MDAAFEDELHLRRVEDVVRSTRGLHLDEGVCLGTGVILKYKMGLSEIHEASISMKVCVSGQAGDRGSC